MSPARHRHPITGQPLRQEYRENTEYAAFAVRIIRAMARRAAGDPDLLPALREIDALVAELMTEAVAGLRAEGYSWSDLAERLGVSKQAAFQRYRTTDAHTPVCRQA